MADNRWVTGTKGTALYFEEVLSRKVPVFPPKVTSILEVRRYPEGVSVILPSVGDFVWLKQDARPFKVVGKVWDYNKDPFRSPDCFVSIYVKRQMIFTFRSWFRKLFRREIK